MHFRNIFENYETNISAKLEKEEKHARISCKNEVKDWSEDPESAACKGTACFDS